MIAYAAIDLRAGRVVQLVGGRVEHETISWPDPLAVARRWVEQGFSALHVVDLDAALGSGNNRNLIQEIIQNVDVPVQVGGGIRNDEAVSYWLNAGAAKVIVGTRAVEDAEWRREISRLYSHRVVVAADVRDGRVVTRGWQMATSHDCERFVATLNDDPLAGVLVTDVSREGKMTGVDTELFTRLVKASGHELIAAGGIRDESDLRALANAGVAGAVLGMALYQGAIDPTVITPVYNS